MNKPLALILATAIAAPVAPHAAPGDAGPAAAAFGNTLMTIDPDGRSRKIWLTLDGRWTGLSRRGLALAGEWKADGDKVCLSQSKPALPGHKCQTLPRLGADVEAKDPGGQTVRIKLVKGHAGK